VVNKTSLVERIMPNWVKVLELDEFNVYLHAYETPAQLHRALARHFDLYNSRRRHSALDRRTPDAVYFDPAARKLAA